MSNDLNYFLQPDETFISDNYDEMVSNFNVFISFWFFNKVPTDLGQILKEQKQVNISDFGFCKSHGQINK